MSGGAPPWSQRLERERQRDAAKKLPDRYCVYFIRMGEDGPIKIGLTSSISARLSAIQLCCPYKVAVAAKIEGVARSTEATLHRRFASGRLHGEWFDPDTPGLRELIADVLRDDLPEYVARVVNWERNTYLRAAWAEQWRDTEAVA